MKKEPTKKQLSNAGAVLGHKGGVISAKTKKAKKKGAKVRKPKVVNKPTARTGTAKNKGAWKKFNDWLKS